MDNIAIVLETLGKEINSTKSSLDYERYLTNDLKKKNAELQEENKQLSEKLDAIQKYIAGLEE